MAVPVAQVTSKYPEHTTKDISKHCSHVYKVYDEQVGAILSSLEEHRAAMAVLFSSGSYPRVVPLSTSPS
jgi:hypothetical protein